MHFWSLFVFLTSIVPALSCSDCNEPQGNVVHTRKVRRMQPEAQNATYGPKNALEWGEINFLHTTDTHGWLEGHLKESNYGADWGDFVSFTKRMKQLASEFGADLLLVDTGDLHDGSALSDVTTPNGLLSNAIFQNIDYDLLAIGNHELYVSEVAYEHFYKFSKAYGDKYITSNVQILNPATGQYEYIGSQYRYYTTERGLRIKAFGVLFDFTKQSNVTKVTKAEDMVKEPWFIDTVSSDEPVDLFVVLGHNPVRPNATTCTLDIVYSAIRKLKPDVPIQGFGGHTHIRDFVVYDSKATMIESGQYCETLGWVGISGLNSSDFYSDAAKSARKEHCVATASRPAIAVANTTHSSTAKAQASDNSSSLRYSRRYLDWNRLTFEYHAKGSQSGQFDTTHGLAVTDTIYGIRKHLNLSSVYGCVPQTYCESCKPYGDDGNIFTLLETALAETVVNASRADIARLIILNTGSVRYDLPKGPFTYADAFTVTPFLNPFSYIPLVPYEQASKILDILNAGPWQKRDTSAVDLGFGQLSIPRADECVDPPILGNGFTKDFASAGRIIRRQSSELTPGYVTVDDFGNDGDDTKHSPIPNFPQPIDFQGKAGFPKDGSDPEAVDLIFTDYISSYVLDALAEVGGNYTREDIEYYLPPSFSTNSYLPEYARRKWQANMPNCPVL